MSNFGIINDTTGLAIKNSMCHGEAVGSTRQGLVSVWRLTRRYTTQHIQPQRPNGFAGQLQVSDMNRIKGAAENADQWPDHRQTAPPGPVGTSRGSSGNTTL